MLFTADDGQIIAISIGSPSKTASSNSNLVRTTQPSVQDDLLELGATSHWHPEPAESPAADLRTARDAILASWASGIAYRSDQDDQPGFRTPQLGALHAIAAHWSISEKPGIVVMPTGTGKTDVMVATVVASSCRTVLVVVPSDALRSQTAVKFQSLGVLRAIGVIPEQARYPVVGTLRHIPKEEADLELFDCCNVIVATMSALSGATDAILDQVAARCTHLFIDEAHHAPADTWNDLRERFAGKRVLQFTATPFRRDGRRMEGRILYNYPLAKAQQDGYFQAIRFIQVWEWDDEEADRAIADAALTCLREDLGAGRDHLLMARADSIDRAEQLYADLYAQHTDLNPVVIHNGTKDRRRVLSDIKARRHRVIVCVDMLGEGFDLPQLKIAALHDAHRSLGVTLQFTGRFTRATRGIGQAAVIANLADRKVSQSLEELYSEDADWNKLLPGLSYEAIQPEIRLSDFVSGLQPVVVANESEILAAATITPKTSAVVYAVEKFQPDAFPRALMRGMEIMAAWKSQADQVLVYVIRHSEELNWAKSKDVTHLIYDLFIVFYDEAKKLLFIHSSIKSTHLSLARAVAGEVTQIKGEVVFRVFHGIERILFYSVGLLRKSGGAVRFQMFAGLDVANAIDPVQQQDATKSNLFGAGYEDGHRITIGCSRKGTIWSLRIGSIPDWIEWCRHVGNKLSDNSISTTDYLDHTLVPEQVTALPAANPICIEWPGCLFEQITKAFDVRKADARVSWLDCDLAVTAWNRDSFEFVVNFPDETTSTFRAALSPQQSLEVAELPAPATTASSADGDESLAAFLSANPPALRFPDGTELIGNILVKPRNPTVHHFPVDSITVQDWTGVDITSESKWKHGAIQANSVQQFVISRLLADPAFVIIIDDDDSGEAADVIGIREVDEHIAVHLFHCKFSGGAAAGARADDLYVVCGQAEKGVNWTLEFSRLAEHIIHREKKTLGGRPTRFERGGLRELQRIERACRKSLPTYSMTIVQPGLSKAEFDPGHSAILGATSLFLRQRLSTPLTVWASA
ncbi:MAG: DEAD/DEAH box helicase family protein [Methylacidiphilales bacterium]|nr:DEAD/DEAH box helicase family protein [Candidatus Methylacidiphilales bacterium]